MNNISHDSFLKSITLLSESFSKMSHLLECALEVESKVYCELKGEKKSRRTVNLVSTYFATRYDTGLEEFDLSFFVDTVIELYGIEVGGFL